MRPAVAAVILAAGRGTRFHAGAKVVAELDSKPLVRHVAEAALASRARPVLVVVGQAAEETAAALAGLDVRLVCGAGFEMAMSRSLKAGLAAIPPSAPGALILLADMPWISASLIDRLIDAFETSAHPDAVVPVHAGQRGNPVLLGRNLFKAVRGLEGDDGAGRILGTGVVELAVEDAAVTIDVDTSDDLLRLGRDWR
ncbi:MAG: nucleotidyltransferase family protein [Methylovirgula sp.]